MNKPRLAFLRAHLRAFRTGMKHSRMTRTELLTKVSHETGRSYPNSRKGLETALTDLQNLMETK